MLQKIKAFLNQPYPDRDDLPSILKSAMFGGLMVFFILFAFRPFGLQSAEESPLTYCLLFGGITILVTLIYEGIIRFALGIRRDNSDWTFGKWLLMVIGLLLFIALANYYVIVTLFIDKHSLIGFGFALFSTILVGIFPVALFGALNMIRNLKANQMIASALPTEALRTPHARLVELPIHNSSKTFSIDSTLILFIEAKQNYVYVAFEDEGGIQNEMIRNTLTAIEDALHHTDIKRSHRSFLVNTSKIASVSGNAQGLTLRLSKGDFEVPVSRKYIPEFRV